MTRPALTLAALAAVAALALDAEGAPATARNALLIIAGVLAASVFIPAMFRLWPGEQPRRPADVDQAPAPLDTDAVPAQRRRRAAPSAKYGPVPGPHGTVIYDAD